MKLSSVFDRYCEWLETYRKSNSTRQVRYAARVVARELGDLDHAALDQRRLEGLVRNLRAEGLAVSSVNAVLRQIRAALGRAVRAGWIDEAPCRVELLREEKRRPHTLSEEEFQQVAVGLDPEDQLVLSLCFYAGLRIGEALALRVCDVDFEGGWIHVSAREGWSPKSSRDRTTWLAPELVGPLKDHLRHLKPRGRDALLFPGHQTVPKAIRRAFRAVDCPRAGPHMLRKSWATRRASEGVPMNVLCAAAGWQDLATAERYVTAGRRELAAWREGA